MKNIQDLLVKLINIPSLTGDENALSSFLYNYLTEREIAVKKFPVAAKRENILAAFSKNPDIILTTHMDTVAPFIKAEIEDGYILGRGACDAKGIIASMIHAFFELEPDLQKRTGLLFVVGEETDSIGARSVHKQIRPPRFFINGEPTGNKLARAQKGTFMFRITTSGKASHSGYPQHGTSAIDLLLEKLDQLKNHPWPQDEFFGETTFNIGKIGGGEAINTLASEATASCCIRVTTDGDSVRKILEDYNTDDTKYEIISASEPMRFYCPPDYNDTISVSYGSDAWYLQKIAPTLMLGPGTILKAHRPDEAIAIDELEQAVTVYKKLIRDLLKN